MEAASRPHNGGPGAMGLIGCSGPRSSSLRTFGVACTGTGSVDTEGAAGGSAGPVIDAVAVAEMVAVCESTEAAGSGPVDTDRSGG